MSGAKPMPNTTDPAPWQNRRRDTVAMDPVRTTYSNMPSRGRTPAPLAPDATVSVEVITPREAKRLLESNRHNRPLRQRLVETLARAMSDGTWVLNGESWKIDVTGSLIDGQHRAAAVVLSGVTITTVVVRGLPAEAQETVDVGLKRGFNDVLGLRGEVNGTTLAAAIRTAWRLERRGNLMSGGGPGYQVPTYQELLDYLAVNPSIRLSISVGKRANKSVVRYASGPASALHYLMSQADSEVADRFWADLAEGTGLKAGDPVLALRELLIRGREVARHQLGEDYRVAVTIKAWNDVRHGRARTLLKWTRGSEEFPTIE